MHTLGMYTMHSCLYNSSIYLPSKSQKTAQAAVPQAEVMTSKNAFKRRASDGMQRAGCQKRAGCQWVYGRQHRQHRI